MASDLIIYQFSRSKVERGDFRHFLELYTPDKLPEGRRLRDMLNCFVFCIEGWDDDPREIELIPEIRRLYSAFHEAWPLDVLLQPRRGYAHRNDDVLPALHQCDAGGRENQSGGHM